MNKVGRGIGKVFKVIAVTVIAMLTVIVVISLIVWAASSGGDSTTSTSTVSVPQSAPARTVTTQPKATQAPAIVPHQVLHYSGNGAKNLGTITVKQDSVLYWTNDDMLFSLNDADYNVFVNTQGSKGTTAMPAGVYRKIDINAIGNWTITIK